MQSYNTFKFHLGYADFLFLKEELPSIYVHKDFVVALQ